MVSEQVVIAGQVSVVGDRCTIILTAFFDAYAVYGLWCQRLANANPAVVGSLGTLTTQQSRGYFQVDCVGALRLYLTPGESPRGSAVLRKNSFLTLGQSYL